MHSFITDEQRLFFESQGYLKLDNVLDTNELAELRAAADEAEELWRANPELPGTRIPEFLEIEAILEYGPAFLSLAQHPKVFPLIRELLGRDIRIIDHAYYISPPGGELDGDAWHTDTRERLPGIHHPRSLMMVRAMWTLEDIPPDGGATLVLPGSQHFDNDVAVPKVAVPEEMPGAIALDCPAGSVYFFNGDVLHSPGTNRSNVTRRMVLFNYGHKWMRAWQGHEASPELAARASNPMERQLLGLTGGYYGEDALLPGEVKE